MSAINQPNPPEEAVFAALQAMRGVKKPSVSSERVVMFGELVHYIHGTAKVREATIQRQLRENLLLRRTFIQLLEQTRCATSPKQALAATGDLLTEITAREFSLKFKPSRADHNQVYVLLSVHQESGLSDGHEPVILASKDVTIMRLCFPALKEQSSQMILVADDERLTLIRDPDAELSLL